MITLNGIVVKVIGAVAAQREATVRWEDGKVRLVAMGRLRGTTGGDLEVVTVCREVERVQARAEVQPLNLSVYGAPGRGKATIKPAGGFLDVEHGPTIRPKK